MADAARGARVTRPAPSRTVRADKAAETRRRLIDAAAKVVGAEGYANASVARITQLADVAQGTFYNYFQSQQDLFDQLLPELGGQMLDFIREALRGQSDSLAREEAGFRAFFAFLSRRPEFYRILNEAETFAPKAFRAHMGNMAEGYVRALGRSHAKGELPGFEARELEVIVYALLAARNYIAYRFGSGEGRPLPGWVPDAYMKLVTGGVRYGGTERRPPRGRQRAGVSAAASRAPGMSRVRMLDACAVALERDVAPADRDASGHVRSCALLGLIEAAGTHAAALMQAKGTPPLQNLSFDVVASTAAARLVATARVEGTGGSVHVAIRIADAERPEQAVAIAQAVYALDDVARPEQS